VPISLDLNILELAVFSNSPIEQAPRIAISLRVEGANKIFTLTHQLDNQGEKLSEINEYSKWVYREKRMVDRHQEVVEISSTRGRIISCSVQNKRESNIDWDSKFNNFFFVLTNSDFFNKESIKVEKVFFDEVEGIEDISTLLNRSEQKLWSNSYFLPFNERLEPMLILGLGGGLKQRSIGSNSSQSAFLDLEVGDSISVTDDFLNDNDSPLIVRKKGGGMEIRRITRSDLQFTSVEEFSAYPISPKLNNLAPLTPIVSEIDLQSFAGEALVDFEKHKLLGNIKLLNLIEELYFFVPLEIALKLNQNGYYQEALDWFRLIYDYRASEDARRIYPGLKAEQTVEGISDRIAEWYADPLNPHALARTRTNSYTVFTMISIANCLLSYANAEFTQDNAESVPRARELYEDTIDLLSQLIPEDPCKKEEIIAELRSQIDDSAAWDFVWSELFTKLNQTTIPTSEIPRFFTEGEDSASGIINDEDSTQQEKVKKITELIGAMSEESSSESVQTRSDRHLSRLMDNAGRILVKNAYQPFEEAGNSGRVNLDRTLASTTGFRTSELGDVDTGWLGDDSMPMTDFGPSYMLSPEIEGNNEYLVESGLENPQGSAEINNDFPRIRLSGMQFSFCVTPNPLIKGLVMAAEANLFKIHNCMNIAGVVRELNPFAAPTDATTGIPTIGIGNGILSFPDQISVPPSNFRYSYLVERSTQLANVAQQMESTFLQYLERFDSEMFSQLQAEQDIEVAKGNIKLQELKVTEANSNLKLAELQRDRSQIQVDGLQSMIDQGLLNSERALVDLFNQQALIQTMIEGLNLVSDISSLFIKADLTSFNPIKNAKNYAAFWTYSISRTASSAFRANLNSISRDISVTNLYASLERRQQEWNYQKSIAQQDVKIGNQQIRIANDRIRITAQEQEISELQLEHAEATLDFIKNKFTNAELYEWMSGILEDVYSYFLQEATVMAKLAEQQLAFERQVNLPNLIKSDYWNVNSNGFLSLNSDESTIDRKGLTGSARLIKDITALDLYAMDTTQKKQQISKTISLNEYDPVRMEMFRNTGRYIFETTQGDFDKDFPGHYMRLIKRVSVTIIALVPPAKGIKASLANNGISNVVTGNTIFQTRSIARNPERISLSSPYNDYGVFNLQGENTQYLPFEGSGVETGWELVMEKAANPFDYRSIADVLVTIEYESQYSGAYEKTVKQGLNQVTKGIIALSLKNDLPDTWFDLLNPNSESAGFISNFELRDSDIIPHGMNPQIEKCRIFLSHSIEDLKALEDGSSFNLKKQESGSASSEGGIDVNLNQFIVNPDTVVESAFYKNQSPIGQWRIELTNSIKVRDMILQEKLNDVLIVIDYFVDPIKFSI